MDGNQKEPSYNPTPAEIEAACAEIQATWTAADRRSRMSGNVSLTKVQADGVEATARFELNAKLAKRQEKMRQAMRRAVNVVEEAACAVATKG